MPATDLLSVDLPAPLSPTSAITSPSRTSKSTSVNAWTDPNDLEIPRSSRRGVAVTEPLSYQKDGGARSGTPPSIHERLLAVLRELADADVALLQELVREQPLVVGLGDRDHRQGDGRLV